MSKKKYLVIVLMVLMFSLCFAGCGDSPGTEGEATDGHEPVAVSFATAGTGGAYYPIAGAWANILTEKIPYMTAVAETSAASYENLRKMAAGEVEIGFNNADITMEAFNGYGDFKDAKFSDMGVLFKNSSFTYHVVVAANSKIETIYDLKGKKVAVGAASSGNEKTVKLFLSYFGLNYDNIDEQFLTATESVDALKDGTIDAFLQGISAPAATIMELATTFDIRFIPIEGEDFDRFCKENPAYAPTVLTGGTYKGQNEDVPSMTTGNYVVCTFALDEEAGYDLVKTIWETRDQWEPVHATCKMITLENALDGCPIPLHPGAYKYYKEIGLDIPDEIVPMGY